MQIKFIKKSEISIIKSIFLEKKIFSNKEIFIYGAGESSVNLKNFLINYDIKIKKFLKEKDFVNIRNYSKKLILNNSYKIRNNKKNFYTKYNKKIIDVDVNFQENFRNYKFYLIKNYNKFFNLFKDLKDNKSKDLLNRFIKVKLSNNYSFIKYCISKDQYYLKKNGKKFDNIVDVGGYNGDTLKFFLRKGFKFKNYFIFEPDSKNFSILEKFVKSLNANNIYLFNFAVGKTNGEIFFQLLGNSKSNIKTKKNKSIKKIKIAKLDKLINKINFLKIDVENYEKQVILGAKKTISIFKPVIACAVYHDKNQLIDIYNALKSINKKYKFELRLHSKSSNELILYAR